MLEILKKVYRKLAYGYKSSSKSYIKYLRAKGIHIGDNTTFYEPNTNYIDTQKPCLIEIGNNVEITRGVTVISHDYAWSVIKQYTGEIIGSRGKVVIGNNVFIGMNTTILQGVHIGNNVIIGAHSVVNRDIPNGAIVAGVPAKIIGYLEEYVEKRRQCYVQEAKDMFFAYYEKHHSIPPKELFDEFFWIFEKRQMDNLPQVFKEKMKLTGNYHYTSKIFCESQPIFLGYDEFVEICKKETSLNE